MLIFVPSERCRGGMIKVQMMSEFSETLPTMHRCRSIGYGLAGGLSF